MLLTADIGNTNIVLALLDHGDRVVSQRRIPSGEVLPPEAYDDAIRRVLEGQAAPEGAVIGSVVPRLTEETARAIRSVTGLEALVVGPTTPAGLDIAIEQPETLGVDLLAADAAAAAEYPLPVVVFDFGTATTVTVVDRQRRYRGGVILAGVKLSLHALFSGTAQLPDIALEAPGKVICSVTEDSLQAGAIYGAAEQLHLGDKVGCVLLFLAHRRPGRGHHPLLPPEDPARRQSAAAGSGPDLAGKPRKSVNFII